MEDYKFKSRIEKFENCDLGKARMEPVQDRIHEKFEDYHSPVNFDDENIKILEPVSDFKSGVRTPLLDEIDNSPRDDKYSDKDIDSHSIDTDDCDSVGPDIGDVTAYRKTNININSIKDPNYRADSESLHSNKSDSRKKTEAKVKLEVKEATVELADLTDNVGEDYYDNKSEVDEDQAESSHLGRMLEERIEHVKDFASSKESSGSSKRKLGDDEPSSCHKSRDKPRSSDHRNSERSSEHRSSKERSSEHKSSKDKSSEHRSNKDHRRRSKERTSDLRKEKSHDKHGSSHRHRDRDGEKKNSKKPVQASVGVQVQSDELVESRTELIVPSDVADGVKDGLQPTTNTTVPCEDEKPLLSFSSTDTPPRKLCGYSLANPLKSLQGARGYKWGHLMYLEVYPNGGGKILHAWQEDLDRLSEEENRAFADEFVTEAFIEVNDFAVYCCAIVHNAAKGLPDFLEYLGEEHSSLPVKHGVIGHPRELETTTMQSYRDKVRDNYKNGTFRFGHLENLSLVGTASEESGGFFPDVLDMLDEIPILSLTLPWGDKSVLHDEIKRNKSNDGPILWIRPGEQSIPTGELGKSPLKRRRNAAINELQNLKYLPRSNGEREVVFEDRTPCHADHVGFGPDRMTTAAVGVLKAVRCEDSHSYNRVSKDTVIFR